jgi:DNA repair protein RadC
VFLPYHDPEMLNLFLKEINGFIFAHNHPNGDPQPSEADRRALDRLTEAAKILGLRILDHVIVTKKGYYSFQESGLVS